MSRVHARSSKQSLTDYMPQRKSARKSMTNLRAKLGKREPTSPWTIDEDRRLWQGLAHKKICLNAARQFQGVPPGFWDIACGFFDRTANACRMRALNMLRDVNNVHINQLELNNDDWQAIESLVDEMPDLMGLDVPSLPQGNSGSATVFEVASLTLDDGFLDWNELLLPDVPDNLPPSTPRLRPKRPPVDKVPPCLLPKNAQSKPLGGLLQETRLLPKKLSSRRSLFNDNIQRTFAFCNPSTPKECNNRAAKKRMRSHPIDLNEDIFCEESFNEIEKALDQPPKITKLACKIQIMSRLWS